MPLIGTNGNIPQLYLNNLGADPTATPDTSHGFLFIKSGGLYIKLNGSTIGPFVDTASAVGALADLSDVSSAAQTAGYVLASSGGAYAGRALTGADLPVVGVTKGGTNIASYAAGDILYASGSTTLAKLAKGTDDQVLTLASGLPIWADASGGSGATIEGGSVSNDPNSFDPFQQTADDTTQTVTYFTEEHDSSTYVDLGTNDDRITIPSGKGGSFEVSYHVYATVSAGSPTNSIFRIHAGLIKNGGSATLLSDYAVDNGADLNKLSIGGSTWVALSAGDYVGVQVDKHTGNSDEVTFYVHLSLKKLS